MRRNGPFLSASFLLIFALGAATPAEPQPTPPRPPIKVGLLLSYTGVFAELGKEVTNGFQLALEERGGRVAGRAIEVRQEDDENKPDVGLTKSRKLVERDRVHVVIGPISSAVALAMRDYLVSQKQVWIINVSVVPALTDPDKTSPYYFRIADTLFQGQYPFGQWAYRNTPYRRVSLMASNFVTGRESVESFAKGFTGLGGTIVDRVFPPLGTSDYAPFLSSLDPKKADAVYAWFAGADAIRVLKQYKEFGLKERLPLMGYNTMAEDSWLAQGILGDEALGGLSPARYRPALATPENRAFVGAYERRYQRPPTQYDETGYTAALLLMKAVELVQGQVENVEGFLKAIREAAPSLSAPRGPIRFNENNQVITNEYISRVDRVGGRLQNVVIETLKAVPQFPWESQ